MLLIVGNKMQYCENIIYIFDCDITDDKLVD